MEDEDRHRNKEAESIPKQYRCQHCGKRFLSGRALGGHARVHNVMSDDEYEETLPVYYGRKTLEEEEDVEYFLDYLDPNNEICPRSTVWKLMRERAIGCLTALVERKIPQHNRLDVSSPDRRYFIDDAALFGFYEAVELFIRHGARISAPLPKDYTYNKLEEGMSPLLSIYDTANKRDWFTIDFALFWISYDRYYSYNTTRQTMCGLLLWFSERICEYFRWWRTVKLLGRDTEQGVLENRIFFYARTGRAVHLLGLLLAVPDRVLSPTFFRGTDLEQGFETVPLREFLVAQLAFVTGVGLTIKNLNIFRLREKQSCLVCSLRLLEVFGRAGPELRKLMAAVEKEMETTYPLPLPGRPIRERFKDVLKEAGFPMGSLYGTAIAPNPDHRNQKLDWDYRWIPQKDNYPVYPELKFMFRPSRVCKSELLDSDFSRVIEQLCHHPHLKEWTPSPSSSETSILKLVFMFCLPVMVEEMHSALRRFEDGGIQPSYLAELCFVYATEGRMVEFTAALMAAQVFLRLGHPLCPKTTSEHHQRREDIDGGGGPPTLFGLLMHPLMRVLDEEISLTGKPKDDGAVRRCKEKKTAISSALLLTGVLEKSAEDIHRYLHSRRYQNVKDLKVIAKEVATLIRKQTGFDLRYRDATCVDELSCFSNKSSIHGTEEEGGLSSFGPGKKTTVSKRTIEGSLANASSISRFSTRSYHVFPTSRFEGSKPSLLPLKNKISFGEQKLEGARRLDAMLRKNWRFLATIKRVVI